MWVAVGGRVFFALVKILTWLVVYGWRCFLMKVDAYSSKRCYYSNPCMDYSRVSFCSWFVVVGIIVFRLSGCLMHIPCAAQASLHSLRPVVAQGSRRHHRLRSDGGAASVWGFLVVRFLARDNRLASLCPVYSLNAGPAHLPRVFISSSDIPAAAAVCAAPLLKECPL